MKDDELSRWAVEQAISHGKWCTADDIVSQAVKLMKFVKGTDDERSTTD